MYDKEDSLLRILERKMSCFFYFSELQLPDILKFFSPLNEKLETEGIFKCTVVTYPVRYEQNILHVIVFSHCAPLVLHADFE